MLRSLYTSITIAVLFFGQTFIAVNAYSEREYSPALTAMTDTATDILVVDVIKTDPREAIEGGRDTAELRIVETLKGGLPVHKTVPLYYHLHYRQDEDHKPTFILKHRYIIFLKEKLEECNASDASTAMYDPITRDGRTYYHQLDLADPWLGVSEYNSCLKDAVINIVTIVPTKKA